MRLYNGCPGPELKELWDLEASLLAKIRKNFPKARTTYFHGEGWEVWDDLNPISKSHGTRLEALQEVLENAAKDRQEKDS